MKKLLIGFIAILFFVFGFNLKMLSAEEVIDYQSLYNQAIEKGVLDQNSVSFDQWLEQNEKEFMPVYQDGLNQGVFQEPLSYTEWLKLNNYGQPPISPTGDNKILEDVTIRRANWGGFTLKAGDIFITNATSSSGILGHAAIANGDNYILHMPGAGEENEQLTTSKWMNRYTESGKWIKVYRLKDQNLARDVARYADRNFYSTTGSATKNIHLSYSINLRLYEKNPTYCSKLVFQALYYGSGSRNVMKAVSGIVTPYGLIDTFNAAYKPPLVKTY
ncbi:hypothetical protein ACRS6Y_20420 [Bacillus cytotoxicus]|uniref:hypothetical protein n=2 Tax=Bacillus cytotoxicus TaxID=580165 RepID=UPI0035CB6B6F